MECRRGLGILGGIEVGRIEAADFIAKNGADLVFSRVDGPATRDGARGSGGDYSPIRLAGTDANNG